MNRTILALLLAALACAAQQPETEIEIGEINGSSFRIDVPANHNGSLVLYCHGYGGSTKFDRKPLNAVLRVFTGAGYAVAQAGYVGQGWAVREAIQDTEALRRYFVARRGAPRRTVVTGHSMGGVIALAIVEKYPESYDASLPVCGLLGPSLSMLQRRIFDLLVVADYYYPGILGSPAKPLEGVRLAPDYLAALQKTLDADPQKRAALLKYAGLAAEAELPRALAFFAVIQKELVQRTGGNPFDNRHTVYHGGADDVALNRGVGRYGADPRAAEYLRAYYTPTARPLRPVLAVHTIYDPIVPAWATNAYGEMVRQNGAEAMFVQRYTAHPGHCNVKPEETLHAFQDLLAWVESGKRPEGGEQK